MKRKIVITRSPRNCFIAYFENDISSQKLGGSALEALGNLIKSQEIYEILDLSSERRAD